MHTIKEFLYSVKNKKNQILSFLLILALTTGTFLPVQAADPFSGTQISTVQTESETTTAISSIEIENTNE
ncbi:MAG: hypothetical protein Q4B70_00650, partial [Lachnospiraceae bacterium]|nr:hypothetical protein [Lachnospiraceae bacterium]